MPATYDFDDKTNSFGNWALCEAMGSILQTPDLDRVATRPLVVEFRVNGVELDYGRVMTLMDKVVDDAILKKAEELVLEKFQEFEAIAVEMREELSRRAKAAFDRLDRKGGDRGRD